MKQHIQDLWIEGYLLSEQLIKNTQGKFYNEIENTFLKFIEVEKLGKVILDYLIEIGKIETGTKIELRTNDQFENDLFGVVDYDKIGKVLYITTSTKLNVCTTRFVCIKELCQIYIEFITTDAPFSKGASIINQIVDLVEKQSSFFEPESEITIQRVDENYNDFLAYFMARNIIIPQSERANFASLWELIKDEKNILRPYDLAFLYRMPEFEITALQNVLPLLNNINLDY